MLDLSLFSKPAFAGASIAAFALSASMFSMFLYLTLYIQNILGYSPLESGLRFLPVTLLSFMLAPISGKLAERLGIRWFLGAGLFCVGLGLFLMSGLEVGDDWTALLAGFLVAGGGIGLVNPPLATAAVGVVEPQRAGMASGHQLDVPAGRHRHRHRRARRDLPAPRGLGLPRARARLAAPAGRAPGRDRRLHLLRRRAAGRQPARWPARPSRRSSTGSTTSSSTPRSSPSWARCWRRVLTRPQDFVAHGLPPPLPLVAEPA